MAIRWTAGSLIAAPAWLFFAFALVNGVLFLTMKTGDSLEDLSRLAVTLLLTGMAGIFAGASMIMEWFQRARTGGPGAIRLGAQLLVCLAAGAVGLLLAWTAAGSRNIPLVLFGLFIAGLGASGVVLGTRLVFERART